MIVLVNVSKEILEITASCTHLPSRNCAIAVAVAGIFKGDGIVVGVGYSTASIYKQIAGIKSIKLDRIELPEVASKFIRKFDQSPPSVRREMSPISFEVDVPETIVPYLKELV